MSLFEMSAVPGTIDEAKKRKGAAKKKPNEAEPAPVAMRSIDILLDVTDDRFVLPLCTVFPSFDMVAKAMGNKEEYPAGKLTMARKLPNLSIVCTDMSGDVIFTAENVKVLNKPELRIAAGADCVEMPLKIRCSIPRDGVQKLDDAVGVDLVFEVKANQMEIDDVIDPGDNGDDPKTKTSKTKTTVTIQ